MRSVLLACFLTGLTFHAATDHLYAQQDRTAPQVIQLPEDTGRYRPHDRRFTGIPSLSVSPGGRMWATWYAGTAAAEDNNNYVVLSTSGDGGQTWEEVLAVDPDGEGPLRAFDPQVWTAPDGSLWFFYAIGGARGIADPVDTWFVRTEDPDNPNALWSARRFLAEGVMMNKPTVLSSGEWLFPVAHWGDEVVWNNAAAEYSARVYVSHDRGENFALLGACPVPVEARQYLEHMLIERRDGELWMLVRTSYGIGESISTDRGKRWSELRPSGIGNPSSRFFITRLSSGNMLLVKNGPVGVATKRSHLMAFVSSDDGLTWSKGLLIDQRGGVAYPDGQQAADGTIHIIYDCNRYTDQLILKTGFTEEDILDRQYDEAMVRVHGNRKTVSRGGR